MTGREFINSVANGKSDIIQVFLDILTETGSRYCLIGGLAVNAYVEPLVSLDLDIVTPVEDVGAVCRAAKERDLKVEEFEYSVNIASAHSDLRIQLQTDHRYQEFISRAQPKDVLGYRIRVADLADVLQGKVWAYMDKARRKSKRQKDLADIFRIVEAFPHLAASLPQRLQDELDKE